MMPEDVALLGILEALAPYPRLDDRTWSQVLARFARPEGGFYSKRQLIAALRKHGPARGWDEAEWLEKLRARPVRTQSGVAPVTVLTKPFPCPGRCVFCPNDVRMPKSYLSLEPGAQRAARHRFDPFGQVWSRLSALRQNGHAIDKIELIVLGGTWSSYPEPYQRWFVKRCLDALNTFDFEAVTPAPDARTPSYAWDGEGSYNLVVGAQLRRALGALSADWEDASWEDLIAAQTINEAARCRLVGMSLETRPDHVDAAECLRLRRLGATKVQIGIQGSDDRILALNQRGHDAEASRQAVTALKAAGFKVQGHWMANLLGATPESDATDFGRLFEDQALRPDELKLYPCSLIETAELMDFYRRGEWRPYSEEELFGLLLACLPQVPRWCRLTRVIRDIPSHDIVVGNKSSHLRDRAEEALLARGTPVLEIRAREVRQGQAESLQLKETRYQNRSGTEIFLELVTSEDRLAGFLRLHLPQVAGPAELAQSAVIREVHVYGRALALGARGQATQHRGLGGRLMEAAAARARQEGWRRLSVISAIGTRPWYRTLGFEDGTLYQHRSI